MRRLSVLAGLLAVALMVAAPAQASEISFTSQSVDVGDTFDVDVMLSGNAATLLSFAFSFSFDTSIATLVNAANGTLFPDDGFVATITAGAGTIINVELTGAVTGNGLLTKLTFTSIAAGNPLLSIVDAALADDSFITDPNAELIVPDVSAGTITVNGPTPVPEPSTLGLVGLGLVSLTRRLRRRPAAN
jgi:PEP-CTERM motif/Cohesin domain